MVRIRIPIHVFPIYADNIATTAMLQAVNDITRDGTDT